MAYTKTNWQDLPDTSTPINAENLNKMEQGIYDANNIGQYSTSEIAVGTWIDGKTIYRKVMIIEGTLGNNTPYPFGVNPDTVIRMDCSVKYSGSNDWRSLPWLYSMNDTIGNGSWAGGFYYRNPNIYFQAGTNLSNTEKTVFIMEYTK